MAQYFHAYRIDHILGFFRIWENPGDAVTAALGTFRPAVALNRWELEAAGVWDFHRLTRPYVRSHILLELFGEAKDEVLPASCPLCSLPLTCLQGLFPAAKHRPILCLMLSRVPRCCRS